MYVVIVQDLTLNVRRVIQCETMLEVQNVLETIEPDMDSQYLINGDASSVPFGSFVYSFRKLENANCFFTSQV